MTLLEVEDIAFAYDGHSILNGVNLRLNAGEIGVLIGTSGSGKTTLFKLLTRLLKPKSGSICIAGESLYNHENVAYMTQSHLLLPWRTVLTNVLLPAELGAPSCLKPELYREARDLLREMDMETCENMFPDELSGGMKQRVSLARALLQKRSLLLLDEPFGSLDVSLREHMYDLLRSLRKKYQVTLLMVTHDFRDALELADRIFLLSDGHITAEWEISAECRQDTLKSAKILEEMRNKMKRTYVK